MKKLSLFFLFITLAIAGFSQNSTSEADTTKEVVINTDSLASSAVVNYVTEFLGRNASFEPTFQLQEIQKLTDSIHYHDSLWPADSSLIKEQILGYRLNYNLISSDQKVDEIIFYLTPDFAVLDSGLITLNYAVQLANQELTSYGDATAKVNAEYPDAIWKSITLKRGKITHYTHTGYNVGDFLTHYYFDGICKTCSYQIIRLQFDAETGKIASELKIKTD